MLFIVLLTHAASRLMMNSNPSALVSLTVSSLDMCRD